MTGPPRFALIVLPLWRTQLIVLPLRAAAPLKCGVRNESTIPDFQPLRRACSCARVDGSRKPSSGPRSRPRLVVLGPAPTSSVLGPTLSGARRRLQEAVRGLRPSRSFQESPLAVMSSVSLPLTENAPRTVFFSPALSLPQDLHVACLFLCLPVIV